MRRSTTRSLSPQLVLQILQYSKLIYRFCSHFLIETGIDFNRFDSESSKGELIIVAHAMFFSLKFPNWTVYINP
jgi:hypothetical protein